MKRDFKKERKDLHSPKEGIFEVTVPSMKYIAVDGGGPLTGENIQKTMDAFFDLAYGIKMSKMKEVHPRRILRIHRDAARRSLRNSGRPVLHRRRGHLDLEDGDPPARFRGRGFFEAVRESVKKKKPGLDLDKTHLFETEEGLSVQTLHMGSRGSVG